MLRFIHKTDAKHLSQPKNNRHSLMDLEQAIKTLQIPPSINPTDDYIKKRYRFIASKIHPDKQTDQGQKLLSHLDFIELQDAYELIKNTDLNHRISALKKSRNSENKMPRPDTPNDKEDFESQYITKKRPFEWLLYLIFPGVILLTMFIAIPTVVWLQFGFDVKDKSESKADYVKNMILYLVFGAIPMIFAYGVFIYLIYDKIINGSVMWWFVFIEINLAILYYAISWIIRKTLKRKINFDLVMTE